MKRDEFGSTVLYVNLTTGKVDRDSLDFEISRDFLGGVGVGWRLAYDLLKPGTDPFSPDNPIIISVGALVGTLAPGASKISATTKFPIIATDDDRHFVASSVGGGREFGIMMRNTGFDHLVITGRAERPAYLSIFDDKIEIDEASDLWGKGADEAATQLRAKHGEDCGVMTIGPAGENLVRYAMAFIDKTNSLGRSGFGAVMGSKNLKAILIRGTKGVRVADQERFMRRVERLQSSITAWSGRQRWLELGMGAGWYMFKYTQYPGRWSRKKWEELYGEEKRRETVEKIIACNSCLISCRIKWKIRDGEFANATGLGSPYGKSATSGQLLDVTDHRKMLKWVILANRAGICFYTTTRLIDFVTTLYQRGIITAEDTGGLKLERNFGAYLDLFNKIVRREGFGDVLADGWLGISQKLGINPHDYWYGGICKGVDFIYDARAAKLHPLMMTFFTNPRPHHGGCHTLTTAPGKSLDEIRKQVEGWGIPEDAVERIFTPVSHTGKFNIGRYTKYMEDAMAVNNSLGACSMYAAFGLVFGEDLAELYSAATGMEVSAGELMLGGERAFNVKKLLNVREGFTKGDDRVPELWLRPMKTPEGEEVTTDYFRTKVLTREDFKRILEDYYDERGWDKNKGIPTSEKLKELKLDLGQSPLLKKKRQHNAEGKRTRNILDKEVKEK